VSLARKIEIRKDTNTKDRDGDQYIFTIMLQKPDGKKDGGKYRFRV